MKIVFNLYQVVIGNLDPTIGSEIRTTLPCVILSRDEMNYLLNTLIIAPVTSASRPYPARVKIKLDGLENWVVTDHIRTIHKKTITKSLMLLSMIEISRIKEVLKETFVAKSLSCQDKNVLIL